MATPWTTLKNFHVDSLIVGSVCRTLLASLRRSVADLSGCPRSHYPFSKRRRSYSPLSGDCEHCLSAVEPQNHVVDVEWADFLHRKFPNPSIISGNPTILLWNFTLHFCPQKADSGCTR